MSILQTEKRSRIFLIFLLMHKLCLGGQGFSSEEKYNISSSSLDGGAHVWVGKDFLEKRSRIFLLLLLMEGLVSGWAKIFYRREVKYFFFFS